jgi:hypothetical protein
MRRLLVAVVLVLIACNPEATLLPAGPNHSPTATFVVPALGREGSQVLLTAEDASDADGDPLTFAWHFGDGDSVMTRDPIVGHVYRNNGSYGATLIVSDSLGAADTSNANTTIANVAPEVTVLSFPDTVIAGTTVRIEIRYSVRYGPPLSLRCGWVAACLCLRRSPIAMLTSSMTPPATAARKKIIARPG